MFKIHHIGYLVRRLDRALEQFKKLGFESKDEAIYDTGRDADIAFMSRDGYSIELVCPHKTSGIYPLLRKTGNSPYHMCFETNDIDKETARLEAEGYTVFIPKQVAPAIGGSAEVVFLIHAALGMIELVGSRDT